VHDKKDEVDHGKQIRVRTPVVARLRKLAAKRGQRMIDLATEAIRQWLRQENRKGGRR